MNIIENPQTKKLYAEGQESLYDFDGTPYAKVDTTGWKVIARNVRCVNDWQAEPGNYGTYYGLISVAMIEKDGRKSFFKMGDNISYLLNWVKDASLNVTVGYVWLGAYSDRNVARSAANV